MEQAGRVHQLQQDVYWEMERQEQLWGDNGKRHVDGTGTEAWIELAKIRTDETRRLAKTEDGPTWADIAIEAVVKALAERGYRALDQKLMEAIAVLQSWRRDLNSR